MIIESQTGMPGYVPPAAIAEMLGLTRTTIQKAIADGVIEPDAVLLQLGRRSVSLFRAETALRLKASGLPVKLEVV